MKRIIARPFNRLLDLKEVYANPESRSIFKQIINSPPSATNFPLQSRHQQPIETPKIHHTTLETGIKVFSEEAKFPGLCSIGLALEVGSRDETKETSGAVHSISLLPFKSMNTTVDTVNYGMVQMSGGKYSCKFDRERLLYKFQCMPHDTVDLLNMMIDCALEPRNPVTVNAAIAKLQFEHKFLEETKSHFLFTDLVLQSIYPKNGLGNPMFGNPHNALKLNTQVMQRFQLDHYVPENIKIVGVGIENHEEFVELIKTKLHELPIHAKDYKREQAQFFECDILHPDAKAKPEFAIVFETKGWKSKKVIFNLILSAALGKSRRTFAHLLNSHLDEGIFMSHLHQKNSHFKSIEAFSLPFTDTGIFGLRATVSPGKENECIELLAKSFDLIDENAFNLAKQRLVLGVIENLSNDYLKVEEYLKEVSVFGEVKAEEMISAIEAATWSDFQNFVDSLKKGKMAFIATGPNASKFIKSSEIRSLFK